MLESIIARASSYASEVDHLILMVAIMGGIWLLFAEGILLFLCLRFRKSKSPKAQYITGEEKHEKKWIHLPHNLVLLCDIAVIIYAVYVWYDIKQRLPTPDATVRVIAQQWAWRFVDPGLDGQLGTPDDVETVNEMHITIDKTYHYKLESTDVLHSFSVPVFRLKQDAIPGRIITGWFKPTKTGSFDIQCAEICGIGHALMPAKLVVESEADHRRWLEQQKAKSG